MGINRCTDSARRNVGLGHPGAGTYSERSRSARLLVIVAAVAIVALFALFWQQSSPLQPAFAGAGDATGPVTITGTAEVGRTLTADTFQVGDTDGITNVSYTYAWYSGGAVVDGETESALRCVWPGTWQQSIHVVVIVRGRLDATPSGCRARRLARFQRFRTMRPPEPSTSFIY